MERAIKELREVQQRDVLLDARFECVTYLTLGSMQYSLWAKKVSH